MSTSIKIPSATPGWNLDTWQYLPTNTDDPSPAIIMAHGLSANKLMSLRAYADTFVALGYVVFVFDYRHWGTSGGIPRHITDVKKQIEDYRTVFAFAQQHPRVDKRRIVLWGTSFSGAHVLTLAADPTLGACATIAQCPYTGTTGKSSSLVKTLMIVVYAVADVLKQALGLRPIYLPAAGPPGSLALLTAPGALSGLLSLASSPTQYPNEIAASVVLSLPTYKPYDTAGGISRPTLLVAPVGDTVCPIAGADRVRSASNRVLLTKTPGGHFEVYPGGSQHGASIAAQIAFLREHVPL